MAEKGAVDFARMYAFHERFDDRFVRGDVRIPLPAKAVELFLGHAEPDTPVEISQSEGRVLTGIIWTNYPPIVLASEAVIEALRAAVVTGWQSYPATFRDARGKSWPYSGLAITGRCGPVDRSRGEWVQASQGRGRALRGLYFDENSWDGSDWFVPDRSAHILVTDRAKSCLEGLGLKNVLFTKLTEDETSEIVIRHSAN